MNKLFLGILALIICLISVSAYGPNYHLKDLDLVLEDPETNGTTISGLILDNYDACLSGLEYPDVGIFEYYTNFKAYAGLHNYNTVDELLKISRNNRDRAFAYCWKIHLTADSVSHNYFVPNTIKSTKLPNYIIHPLRELSVDGKYLDPRTNRLMEGHAEFDDLVTQATGRDWSSEAQKLNIILGGNEFYTEAYVVESVTFWGRVQNTLFWIIQKVIPEPKNDYLDLSVNLGKGVLRGETPDLDPSGENSLNSADKGSSAWLWGITLLVIIVFFAVSIKKGWIWPGRRR